MNKLLFSAAAALLSASVAQAQLTWDVVPGTAGVGDGAITHSNGVWDATTGNWTADAGANNVVWSSDQEAVFGNNASNTAVTVDIPDAGVTVGDLTLEAGTGKVSFKAITDNIGAITLNPGTNTWDTGGREIEIVGLNTANDTRLLMSSSNDTLAVVGGGTFDAGEKQQGANWVLNNATLDIQEAMTVRGNANNIGQFGTIKLADGTTYIHERNSNQTYGNPDWDLGAGVVTFKTRYTGNGNMVLNGNISGSGTMQIQCNPTRLVQLNNATNDFTGKFIVGSDTIAGSELQNTKGDLAYGPVPASVVPDYFTLKNGGELKLNGFEINANRGITLDGSGKIINNTNPTIYGGKITGDGQLIVGRNEGSDGNQLFLYSNTHDYTGGTRIWQGSLKLGIDNALPNEGVLTLGGGTKNGRFYMNGFDQTIGGLEVNSGSTREVLNNSTTNSTLTFDVASGKSYNYPANINGTGDIALVKEGDGTQRLTRTGGFSKNPVSLTINAGVFEQSCTALPTPITVNSGGTLAGIGTTLSNVVVNSGGSIAPGNATGWNSVKISGADLDLSNMIDDNAGGLQIGFGSAKDSIVVSTNVSGVGGTIDMNGITEGDLGFSDFTFTTRYASDLPDGTYAILVANNLIGTIDTNDNSGAVGSLGATGELSISNNTVYLTVDGADSSKYGQWARVYDLPKDAELVDTDDDGYNNLQEFAYGGDPTNSAITGMVPVANTFDDGSTNWLTMVYGERTNSGSGVSYDVETVDNLVIGTWTNNGVFFMGYGETTGDDITPVTNAIPIDGTQDFLGVFLEKQE